MEVKLLVKKGTTRTRVVQLKGDETIVGRRTDCDLRIESAAVSRRHCLIRIQPNSVSVEDLDSINGTLVNGTKVKGKQLLRSGDKLQIGPICFTVQYEMSPPPSKSNVPAAAGPAGSSTRKTGKAVTQTRVMPKQPADEDDELDVLPLVDEEDTSTPLATDVEIADAHASASMLESLEVAEKLESSLDWHLPDSNELRDLLADMDEKGKKPLREV